MKLLCFIFLIVHWAVAQNQLPYNISDYVEDLPVYVSPCGVAVVRFQVNQSVQQPYFFSMTFTAITAVPFRFSISLKGPNGPSGSLDFAQCAPLKTCTSSPCVLIDGCGDQGSQWYAYVETVGLDAGQFSMKLETSTYPTPTRLSIDADNNVANLTRFGGSPLGAGGTTLSQYDYYTFTVGNRPPGTVMNIEIKPETGTMNTVLYRGNTNANPFAGCTSGTLNRTRLESCEVAAGGQWSLAVERTVANQFYLLRLWYDDAINYQLSENVGKAASLKAVDDVVYFRYDVPAFTVSGTTARQIYFVLDNVVGGVVQIQAIYNQPPGSQCAGGDTCQSLEGCHLVVENCNVKSGYYTVVAKAMSVYQDYTQVSFDVRAYLKTYDVAAASSILPAGTNVRGSLKLSEYGAFKFTQPTQSGVGDWLDIEFYVDRSEPLDIVPATIMVGTSPFPRNETYLCGRNYYAKCDASIHMGNQRYCFLQLDPCDLELFKNGIYINVYYNNQLNVNTALYEHTFFQREIDFTIYTTLRNPNQNLINHGTVITDEVTEDWKKAYRIDDSIRSGALEVVISANYHQVWDESTVPENDTARVELDVDVIYAQSPYIGPKCLSCYRVQQSYSISLSALETHKIQLSKCVQGDEHVYLVITGNNTKSRSNYTAFNFTENRYVITAKNIPVLNAEVIKPTQFSNVISQANAFGGLQYWLLDFNRELLRTSTLTLKLRAHPRSGRKMTLFIEDGFDPNCASANRVPICGSTTPGLQFSCGVNNTNKGFCYINIQPCYLIPNMNRTFYVEVRSTLGYQNLTVPDVEVEYAYSFTYDLVPAAAKAVALGKNTQIIVDLEAELYNHFSVSIPAASVGRDTLIFEAYFDSNNLYATQRPINLYVNAPSGKTLAGEPSHSAQCLCYTYQVSDINKVVLVIDRCDLEAGTYYFSVYTDSFGFKEGTSHVTIKAYTTPYVVPITFEDPHDFSLFKTQSAAYQINLDANLLADNGRTDKELQVWAFSNIAQYNASVQTRLANNIAACGCGQALTDVSYPCSVNNEDSRATQPGRCDIIGGPCNFQAGPWYIITTITEPDPAKPIDFRHVVPFTLTATKKNTITTVDTIPLVRDAVCDYTGRGPAIISATVKTEEWRYFSVIGQPAGFSIYVDNITFGSLTIYAGTNLPTVNCSVSQKFCPETPVGGNPCVLNFFGCSTINYIGIKVVSNKKNTDVRFQISSCILNTTNVPVTALNFGNRTGTEVQVQNGGTQPIVFSFPQLQVGQSPYVIVSITTNSGGGDSYVATLGRGGCTTCSTFSTNCTNVGKNCTMYIPFCDLPSDYKTGTWNIEIRNNGPASTFYAVVFDVNNNIGNLQLSSNSALNVDVQPLSWVNVAWTLNPSDLVPFGTGTQSSSISFTDGANAANLIKLINDGTGLTCLTPFTNNNFAFSSCCTSTGVRVYSFFNRDFQNIASVSVLPTLTTYSQNHTFYAWPTGAASISKTFSAVETDGGNTRLVEYSTILPGTVLYGTMIFQSDVPSGVNIYLQRNYLAGPVPPAKGGCFTNEFTPSSINNVATQTLFACAGSVNPLPPVSLDVHYPQTLYIAYENSNNVAANGTFNISFVTPITIVNNTQSAIVNSINTVNQQFIFKPSVNAKYLNRKFRFNVTVITGTVTMYINRKTAAGPAGGCTSNVAASPTPTSTVDIINYDTCVAGDGNFYVGIVTSSPTSSYVVTATEINTLYETTPPQFIFPSVPYIANSPSASENYDVTFTSIPPNSYLRVSVDNITIGSTYKITVYRDGTCQPFENTFCGEKENFGGQKCSTYKITVYRDGTCQPFENTFCGEKENFGGQKCSTILSGCQLQANVLMHVVVEGPAGAPYLLLAEIITFSLTPNGNQLRIQTITPPTGNPGELLFSTFTSSITPHDLALYQVPLPPRSVLPGENVRVLFGSTDCGAVDSWGYVGGPAGPFCSTNDVLCSAAGCLITSLKQCDTFRSSTRPANANTDLYILVRGKAHAEGNVAIRFSLKVERDGSYVVRHMYYLEKHNILPVKPTPASGGVVAQCPASKVPAPLTCCPVPVVGANSWIWQPTVFHFPLEGARYLNEPHYQRLKLSIDNSNGNSPYVSTATLRVWNQQPSFCPQDFPSDVTANGEFQTCTVTQANPNCTVNLLIDNCGLVDSHLFFFTVDNIQFNALPLPSDIANFREGVSISHTRIPNVIIPVYYNTKPQYFEGDLIPGQLQYFKVFHNNVAQANYHFTVQIMRVSNGAVALHHHWSECPTNEVCVNYNCRDIDPRDPLSNDCKSEPDCTCDYEQIGCRSGDMNKAPVKEGFFTLRGVNVTGGIDAAHYVVSIEFAEVIEPITQVICGNETCEQERYYNQIPQAGPEELYRFRISSVNGKSNILIANDGVIGLDGYLNPVQGASCQKNRLCDSLTNGQLDECVTFYRTPADLTPYASVHTTDACVDHRITRFNLNYDKLTPPITTLRDGILADSQVIQTSAGCNVINQTYWYKIQTNGGQYMVVELWGTSGENMQLWVQKNHVTFNQYGEDLSRGCQTQASGNGLYCRYVMACTYTPGLYYIQVSDSSPLPKGHPYFRHQIKVSTMSATNIDVNMGGADVRFDLTTDLRQIQTVTINNVGGNQEQPWKDLIGYTFSQYFVDSWMTRNKLGDASCAVSGFVNRQNSQAHTVNECQVDASGGVFKVHFMANPGYVCAGSRQISVSPRFNQPGVAIQTTNPANSGVAMNIPAGGEFYVKHTVPALQNGDIVYHRLSNFDTTTRLTTTLWKGNHLNTDRSTYALPCSAGCAKAAVTSSQHLSWGDSCFHCGSGLYNTIFTQINANVYTGNTSLINTVPFTSTLSVVQPVALTSTARTDTFPKEEASLKFYSAENPRDRGSRIELVIAKGGAIGVEINLYSQDCALRTAPSQYWCFPGHTCSIPFPENHNFGDFYQNSQQTAPYISSKFLLVVKAVDATISVSQVTGTDSCNLITPALAPFCAPLGAVVTARTMWGNTNTFLQKDKNAQEFYFNLTRDFSCNGGNDHCDCEYLSTQCKTNLQIYACLSMFNPCDTNGLELQPKNEDCTAVESTCPKTFRCAGYPERSCGSSFYFVPPQPTRAPTGGNTTIRPSAPSARTPSMNNTNTTKAPTKSPVTTPTNTPTTQPTEAPTDSGAVAAFPGWIPGVVIFLIVLVAILLVTTIAGAVLMCTGSASAPSEVDAYQAL